MRPRLALEHGPAGFDLGQPEAERLRDRRRGQPSGDHRPQESSPLRCRIRSGEQTP